VERSLSLHGMPVTEADVVLVDGTQFAAAASTGPGGRFGLPDGPGTLLVRVRRPAIAVAAVPPTAEPDIDLRPKLCRISGTIVASGAATPPLTLYVDPVDVDGLTPVLEAFVLQRSQTVRSSHYAAVPVPGETFEVTVAAGTYRLTGNRLDYDQGRTTAELPPSVTVDAIRTAAGESLPGEPWGGFRLSLDGDTELILTLREAADDEL
jgi:hypothetical protein